jgi:UDP-N-acetylglucosamine 2-epimerase (non-hydrolysing)
MAPIIRTARLSPSLDVRICVTGQHREMLDQALEFFCICPDHDLAAMQNNQDLSSVTARVLERLRPVLLAERPDLVMVQGDTVSAFAGSLAAFFERVPVGHIEAGLRTNDVQSPFPEEAMRQMITRLAAFHFAPTAENVNALRAEGVAADHIFLTGNPGVDSVLWTRERLRGRRVNPLSRYADMQTVQRIQAAKRVILVTGHRRENLGVRLGDVCLALGDIATQHPDVAIVYPVHPNPSVRDQVSGALVQFANIFLLPPLDYPAFVHLMDLSSLIVTDSGGVQEEAPALGKPVLVTRTATERMEAVRAGAARVVGTERGEIVRAVNELLQSADRGPQPERTPFGDGSAAEKIVRIVEQYSINRATASLQALMTALGTSVMPQVRVPDVTAR